MEKRSSGETSVLPVNKCKICEAPAKYVYFGAVACNSCKMFFKRNAEKKQKILQCDRNGHCQINLKTRHACGYCRLMKCFESGIQIEKLRGSHAGKQTRKNRDDQLEPTSTSLVQVHQPKQVSTLNLLRSDQSTLTIDQWNHFSNLSHCFDEHSGISIGTQFVYEQNNLPVKCRFKCGPLTDFIMVLMNKVQLIYKNNQDFLSLDIHDRSILFQNTIKHVGALSVHFIFRQIELYHYPACYQSFELLFGHHTAVAGKHIDNLLDFDGTIVKHLLAILVFSTTDYTVYSPTNSNNLKNITEILRIQDTYTELVWVYLVYKYSYEQAVIYFSNIIRCLFAIHETIVRAYDVQQYTNIIDTVVQQTKQTLTLNS